MKEPPATAPANFLESTGKLFRFYRKLGEDAMEQVSDEDLFWTPAPETNSIAVIAKHLSGNMLSRWTDFLITDGEKPWRDRDGEFESSFTTRDEVKEAWEKGWQCLFDHLDPLKPEDLGRLVFIRNEGHTVLEAINRQLTHCAYHVGQIVALAKQAKGAGFRSLSIPRGGSAAYNAGKFDQDKGRRHFV